MLLSLLLSLMVLSVLFRSRLRLGALGRVDFRNRRGGGDGDGGGAVCGGVGVVEAGVEASRDGWGGVVARVRVGGEGAGDLSAWK